MQERYYPPDTGPYARLSEDEKKKRLDAMVRVWATRTTIEDDAGLENIPSQ